MGKSSVRVRFAPSPTGELHLGGARTALFNWLFAKNQNGMFFLRIEDTDTIRSKEEYTTQILDSLSWLGLDWDEPLVYQSGRSKEYRNYLNQLIDSGIAYRCFCSKNDLDGSRAKGHYKYSGKCRNISMETIKERLNQGISFTYRIRIPDGKTKYNDLIYGKIEISNDELDDFIIFRSDGTPTYNFTAVIDDHDMLITHIIRGEDHLSNTPKQIILHKALGFEIPTFAHLPMILGSDKKRLSKRHGAPGIQFFKEDGYLPLPLINYLALLGWNSGDKDEIFTLESLIEKFDLKKIQKKGAIWDPKKLNWLSGQHIINLQTDFILDSIRNIEPEWGKGYEISYLVNIIEILKIRSRSLKDIINQSELYFNGPDEYDPIGLSKCWKEESVNFTVKTILNSLDCLTEWRKGELETTLQSLSKNNQISMGKITMPLRIALLGSLSGPSVVDLLNIIGKKDSIDRINKALNALPL